jgi:hypothetical protein
MFRIYNKTISECQLCADDSGGNLDGQTEYRQH